MQMKAKSKTTDFRARSGVHAVRTEDSRLPGSCKLPRGGHEGHDQQVKKLRGAAEATGITNALSLDKIYIGNREIR